MIKYANTRATEKAGGFARKRDEEKERMKREKERERKREREQHARREITDMTTARGTKARDGSPGNSEWCKSNLRDIGGRGQRLQRLIH
ncbi:hypothetical protein X777_08631 [Ooceraea biroi]|uniref:Uncharacterized protein n=1 Tax=Ooceraea biroi TaxID=2015173 RepID=A0A026X1S4_OOCBI|nr:hypothetical protein X777_08631 [Ooceraea biroi]